MKSLYQTRGEKQKVELLDKNLKNDYDDYLLIYGKIKGHLSESEKDFFNYNAVIAYREKLFNMQTGES